jgi:hypothetical protein
MRDQNSLNELLEQEEVLEDKNYKLLIEDRVTDLLGRVTLEKAAIQTSESKKGEFQVMAGNSSRDSDLQKIIVTVQN